MTAYEEFHVSFKQDISRRVAQVLKAEGIRFRERTSDEAGTEYVIEVHVDDLKKAEAAFWNDAGDGRSFSGGQK